MLPVHRAGHPPRYAFPAADVASDVPSTREAAASGYVTVKWDARDKVGDCNGGCYAMAYIGASAPSSSASFTSVGVITDLWPNDPFGTSTYYVPPGPTDSVYVAVGWKAAINTTIQGAKVRHDCISVQVP